MGLVLEMLQFDSSILSLAKILPGREINSLRDFLNVLACYNSASGHACSGSGSD